MRYLTFLLQKFQTNCILMDIKKFPSSDFAAMLCFLLGVYGERFFLYVYSMLGAISPEMFSFVCMIGSYSIVIKFIKN